jgi:chorismate mutase
MDGNGHEQQAAPLARGTAEIHQAIVCRGIRGATTVEADTAEDILEATRELLLALIRLNDLRAEDVASVVFTTTPDLTATFPALAARDEAIAWTEVPLLCTHEMAVPGSLEKAVRILLHVNTARAANEIKHVYLRNAGQLRPDWAYTDAQLAEILAGTGAPTPTRG